MEYKIKRFALEQMTKWGLLDKGWTLKFTNAKKQAGYCNHSDKIIGISKVLLVAMGLEEAKDTVLHEIAHAIVGYKANHNHIWKATARKVGAKPNACYSSSKVDKSKINYKYTLICPKCQHKIYYSRQLKYNRSCGVCHPHAYNEEYKLIVRQNY